jgi:hypothetical protein
MKILVACEYSGIVRDAFSRAGHDAWSCDLLPTESELTRAEGKHIQGDVLPLLAQGWDMLIAFPPCTYLSFVSQISWNKPGRLRNRLDALEFFAEFWLADVPRICIENPLGCASPTIAKYSQIVQPYEFGDPYIKRMCLWLKGLPVLTPTEIVTPVAHWVGARSKSSLDKRKSRGLIPEVAMSKPHPFALLSQMQLVRR